MRNNSETQKGYIEGGYKFFFLEDQKKMDFEYHYHSFHKCLIVLEGKIKYEIEGLNYDLSEGDIIWVPSYEAHKVFVSDEIPYKRIVVYLSKQFVSILSSKLDRSISQMGTSVSHCVKFSQKDREKLISVFPVKEKAFINNENARDKNTRLTHTNNVFDQSLNTVSEFITWMNLYFEIIKKHENTDFHKTKDNLIGKQKWMTITMNYIKENLREELKIDDIASQVYLSKYYFMRKFKEVLGISIHQYIIQQRLIHARYLMKQGMSLTEISYQSGFKDYSTFARSFKKTYNRSPREFQKLNPTTEFE